MAGNSGRGQCFSMESLKGFGVSREVGWRKGLWRWDTGQWGWRDAAGGLAAPSFGVAAQHMKGTRSGLWDR